MKQTKLRWNIILWMGAVHLAALISLPFVNTACLMALAVLYPVTAIGVTLGYHRMMSHKAFKAPKWLERILMTIATLSVQGGPIEWVGLHRHHHLHSDQPVDHHNSRKGLWWSHMGWMFQEVPAIAEVPARDILVAFAADKRVKSTGAAAPNLDARREMSKTKEQLEEERRNGRVLARIAHPLRVGLHFGDEAVRLRRLCLRLRLSSLLLRPKLLHGHTEAN